MPSQLMEIDQRRLALGGVCVCGGVASQALASQTILGSQTTATTMFSPGLWQVVVNSLGGRIATDQAGGAIGEVDFVPLFAVWLMIAGMSGLIAARLVRCDRSIGWAGALASSSLACGWWWLMGVWELSRLLAFSTGWQSLENFLLVSPQMWQVVALAGWLTQSFSLSPVAEVSKNSADLTSSQPPKSWRLQLRVQSPWFMATLALIAIYVIVFTAMNWRLWFNLRIPHGDSAMYEEHLWNLWHGQGFRSYLDQGLFLGEHIQVIHLLLLPLHRIWPSHLLLELCESSALAIGAIPVFRMTLRSTGSARAACLMSAAYLLYSPLHFLDIEVDLKTFRPESFCVPFFLFAFDALESGRLRRCLVLFAFALSAKEDYSIIITPLGVWMAATSWWAAGKNGQRLSAFGFRPSAGKEQFWAGCGLAIFGVAYLLLAILVVIPWFRSGAELHYVRYFPKFGSTMGEVVKNMLTNPSLLFGELLTAKMMIYALSLLLPVGFLSLLSPGRLAVALPLFGILCLSEFAADGPHHHFHAPLVPIVFWATSVGVGCAGVVLRSQKADTFARQFVVSCALMSGLFFSMSPAGITFWDPHASMSLWKLYARDPGAAHFDAVLEQIPLDAKVASTDFVHPRFTHHARSYDYSHYRRRVAGYEDQVPDDTTYIVIDTRHPYSDIKRPGQVRELREESPRWDLLPDVSHGNFIVLRRRNP